jgi:anti-anti-sigma factor
MDDFIINRLQITCQSRKNVFSRPSGDVIMLFAHIHAKATSVVFRFDRAGLITIVFHFDFWYRTWINVCIIIFGLSEHSFSFSSRGGIMELSSRKEKGAVIVAAKGRINAVTAPDFEKSIADLTAGEEKFLVVNLGELEYISSAGLRVILATAKNLKAKQGDILLVGLQGTVKEVFELSGFYSIFKIFDTEEAALGQV